MKFQPKNPNLFIKEKGRFIFKNPRLEVISHSHFPDNTGLCLEIKFTNNAGKELYTSVNYKDILNGLQQALNKASDMGLCIPHGKDSSESRENLKAYLLEYKPKKTVINLPIIGYHEQNNCYIFVLPDQVIGDNDGFALKSVDINYQDIISTKGTIKSWANEVVSPFREYPQLIAALGTAFSGMLLRFIHVGNAIVHFYGEQGLGKTTVLIVAASVLGKVGKSSQDSSYIMDWNSTANAMEKTFFQHNDMTAILDEIILLGNDPKTVRPIARKVAHTLNLGRAKDRLNSALLKSKRESWNCTVLSSGNFSLGSTRAEEPNKKISAAEVRFIDIPFIFNFEEGLNELSLPKLERLKPETCAKIHSACENNYGVAGQEFIRVIIDILNKKGEQYFSKLITKHMNHFYSYLRIDTEHQAQGRTSPKFALMYAALKIARDNKVLQNAISTKRILKSVASCYLAYEHNHGEFDPKKAVLTAKNFIQNNADKFITLTSKNKWKTEKGYSKFKDTYGFVFSSEQEDKKYYLIKQNIFHELVCKGFLRKQMIEALDDQNFLQRGNEDRPTKKITWRTDESKARKSFYWIDENIIQD